MCVCLSRKIGTDSSLRPRPTWKESVHKWPPDHTSHSDHDDDDLDDDGDDYDDDNDDEDRDNHGRHVSTNGLPITFHTPIIFMMNCSQILDINDIACF